MSLTLAMLRGLDPRGSEEPTGGWLQAREGLGQLCILEGQLWLWGRETEVGCHNNPGAS